MTIARKILLTIILSFLLIVASGGFALIKLVDLARIADRMAEDEIPAVRYSSALRAEVLDFRNREAQLLIARAPGEIDETLNRQKNNVDNLKKFENQYQAVARRDQQRSLLAGYRQALDAYMKTGGELVRLLRAGEDDKAIAHFRSEQRQAFRALLPILDKIVEDSVTSSDQLRVQAAETRRSSVIQLVVVLILGAVLTAVMGWALHRGVVVPLDGMRKAVANILETRDFRQPLSIKGQDEVAQTAAAVDRLTAAMRETLRGFLMATDRLVEVVDDLARVAKKVTDGSVHESEAAASMAACIEELTVSIQQVAENAQTLAQAAQDSDVAARDGGAIMEQTIDEIRQVGGGIRETAASIKLLEQSSGEITSIVQVIREVADQTNLLALNAAIEAARAGEQGRGFAVVADEVRKLAERTAMATQDIEAKIAAIKRDSETAGGQMTISVTRTASSMDHADGAVSAVGRIKAQVARVDSEVQAIAVALREQSHAGNEIAGRVSEVSKQSDENRRSAEQAASLSRTLADLATSLRDAASRYQV